ncbi:MAG: beta-propeller domain-containing protein [Labilithrix sp.]|nr:beta-propeller domain-containing protein [Labilithrix sp.]
MRIHTAFVLLAAMGSTAGLVGCGNNAEVKDATGTTRASLHRAKGCGDLLVDLKADATFKLNKGIDRQIEQIQKCILRNKDESCAYYGGYYGGPVSAGGAQEDGRNSAPTAPPSPAPSGGFDGSGSGGGAPKASSHSETNTQVKGVDEADIVKTDGSNLYVIHGNSFKIVKAWPANDLHELSSFEIEGQPSEMFVDGGKVVVYSQVNGASLYTAAGVTPKETYTDYGYGYGGGGAAPSRGDVDMPMPMGPGGGSSGPYIPLTKITVLTHDGVSAQLAREIYFEGSYLDSRRVGNHVRTVFSGHAHGPKLKYGIHELYPQPTNGTTTEASPDGAPRKDAPDSPTTPTTNPYPKTGTEMIAALEQLRAANKAAIDASVLNDWIPNTFVKEGATVRAQSVACEDFYVPTVGSTESGLTEVASIDLANPAALPKETAILGRAETVYGSADTLYLAAAGWVEPPFSWADDSTVGSDGSVGMGGGSVPPSPPQTEPAPAPAPGGVGTKSLRPQTTTAGSTVTAWAMNKTHVHKFEFATDPQFPNYTASGTVVGNVKDQFSLDDKDGFLRIATTEQRMYVDASGKWVQPTFPGSSGPSDRPQQINHVFVMGVNGPWLDTVGDVGELAPNEQIYSVRFVGTRGYVVTFRRVDPLFVIDLAQPNAPTKLAELKIPGFSEYMHPLGPFHILTIGRDADDTGRSQGLQLQIFDVSDGTNPILAHKFTYNGSEYGHSEAEQNHKAFTYFEDRQTLAFPYYAYTPSSGTGGGMRSSLELFKVDTGAGFSKLGSIDHTPLFSANPAGYCGGYYGPEVRRGVFLDNFVYAISYGGIVVKDTANLAATGSSLALSSPLVNPGYGPSCGF